jgi:competence protein ComGC
MEVVIRVALMFFLIQFLVVLTIMIVALLLARPEAPLWSRAAG